MTESVDLVVFYLIDKSEDITTARGPYNMTQAEDMIQPHEKIISKQKFAELSSAAPQDTSNQPTYQIQHTMLQQIRSWGVSLLFLGGLHLFLNGFLSSSWGILLFIVGLSSFFFRSSAMFVIYGVTLAWAGLSNLFAGSGSWVFFSLVQFYFAFQVFRQFFYFRQAQENFSTTNAKDLTRTTQMFPLAGCILGSLGLLGFILFIVAIFVIIGSGASDTAPDAVVLLEGVVVNLAILGFSTGLASLLSRYPKKWLAVGGMVAGGLVMLIELGFNLLA